MPTDIHFQTVRKRHSKKSFHLELSAAWNLCKLNNRTFDGTRTLRHATDPLDYLLAGGLFANDGEVSKIEIWLKLG